jgi:hypothetical protein
MEPMNRTHSLFSLTFLGALAAYGCSGSSGDPDGGTPDVPPTDVPAGSDVVATDRPDAASAAVVVDAAIASDVVAPRDVLAPSDVTDAALPTDAGTSCALTRALVTTSDFSAGGYALGALATPALMAAGGMAPDQDHVPVQSGCVVYNLLRGNDILAVLDSANLPAIARRIPLRGQIPDAGSGPYQVNPYDVLTVSPTKAYVVQFGLAHVAVVNPTVDGASAITARIDLGPVRHPMDMDPSGAPEATRIVRVGDRALIALQNLSAFAPIANGTLAVINTTTDALVDLDPMTNGVQGVTLTARNPSAMTLTPSGARVVVSSVGVQAFAPPQVLDGAVEALDAMTLRPTGMRVTEMAFGGDLGDVVMLDEDRGWAVVSRLPSDAGAGDARVMEFSLATGTVGRTIYTAASLAGLARDPNGSVWVLDRSGGASGVRVFNADGTARGGALTTALPPYGIAFVP